MLLFWFGIPTRRPIHYIWSGAVEGLARDVGRLWASERLSRHALDEWEQAVKELVA